MKPPKRAYAYVPLNNPNLPNATECVLLSFQDTGSGAVYLAHLDGTVIGSVERFTQTGGATFSGWIARVGRDHTTECGLTKREALAQLALMAEEVIGAPIVGGGRSRRLAEQWQESPR